VAHNFYAESSRAIIGRLNIRFGVAAGTAVLAATIALLGHSGRARPAAPRIGVEPGVLVADGYDTAVVSIDASAGAPPTSAPHVSLEAAPHLATIEDVGGRGGHWRARIRAGIIPGHIAIQVAFPGAPAARTSLVTTLDTGDSAEDGTPDFLRLTDAYDRAAFRRWFTYLAEAQYFADAAARAPEITDCAALIRYAYREALRAHDGAWAANAGLRVVPALDSVARYQYPFTPLGAALFRVRAGPFRAGDLNDGAFLEFADARTLWRSNTHLVSHEIDRARPGDLLFYRQDSTRTEYHSMIYLGGSAFRAGGGRYLVYHTGPDGKDPGEIRLLSTEDLMRFPQAEWRPIPANPHFLGVYCWNILRETPEGDHAGR
jgi:uncharacterized protein YfaT (DUF1175 family)